MGVTGTGQENFYRLFDHYQDALNYDTVVIMSISDDLRRPLWSPINKDGWLHFCRDREVTKECKHSQKIARLIDYNINRESLLMSDELYLKKAYRLLKSKYRAFRKAKENADNKSTKSKPKYVTPYKIAIPYISKIKELADKKGKRVIFIHIPEKSETKNGYYRYNIANRVKAMGIEYYPILKDYKFDLSMFHIHDGHPNDKGYAKISSIVESILKLKEK